MAKIKLSFRTHGSFIMNEDRDTVDGTIEVDTMPYDMIYYNIEMTTLAEKDPYYESSMKYIADNNLVKSRMTWKDVCSPGIFYNIQDGLVVYITLPSS